MAAQTAAQGARGQLIRANTDDGPRRQPPAKNSNEVEEENWELRHGWEDQYNSNEYLSLLSSAFYMYYTDKRHETGGNPKEEDNSSPPQEWRMRDRLKTVSAALAICLNIGVDPPDVIKTNPSAKLECWIDPSLPTTPPTKTMEQIGKKLQEQYETLSIRTRYKQYLDPSVDETKKFCTSLRRNAKDERVLFHYNGHGVPLPTQSGEIWVFNKNYTQYIPVSLYDLQLWLGAPSLYVYDCSHAGNIIHNFDRFVEKHEAENLEARQRDPNVQLQIYSDNIQLAACGKSESLPTNPDLPADLFTCCLTTPIEIALRFFFLENQITSEITLKDLKRVPGRLQERRTPLGELNWIFTAITDTIAWNILPRALFKKLFRQDLMVAALFRNFLLSERIMRANHCHPMSSPALPETHNHPLWQSWDLALEMVLAQLPAMLASEDGNGHHEYQHSDFFSEQLTAFEVYLSQGAPQQKAPDQLPIVLQVLLSQVHRLRALILLSRFLDLGPWAVNLALSIGIFPYVLKLLQSAAQELKPVMIFIWARILAVDRSCQTDLLKDNGYQYFVTVLHPQSGIPVGNASEHRAMSAFIVAMFCKDFHQGQVVCLSPDLIEACLNHLKDGENPLLRQWSCLCISTLWADFPDAKWAGIRALAHQKLCEMALDPVPEVRAAALHALTSFIGIPDLTEQVAQIEESIASTILVMTSDGNSMVRKELLVFFSTFVKRYENKFLVAAYEEMAEERDNQLHPSSDVKPSASSNSRQENHTPNGIDAQGTRERVSKNSVQGSMWKHLLIMSVDPYPETAQNASIVIDYVHEKLLDSALGPHAQSIIDELVRLTRRPGVSRPPSAAPLSKLAQTSASPSISTPTKSEGYLSLSMKRTASVAASLKHLAFGTASSAENTTPSAAPSQNATSSAGFQKLSHQRQPSQLRPRQPAEWSRPPDQHDHTSSSAAYQHAKTPLPRGFVARDKKQKQGIPLRSGFFDWSIEYFREPQMKPNEPDEPGSDDYNMRLWRRVRNEQTLARTQPLKGIAGNSHWDVAAGFFNNGSQPMKICFHQFEEHLVVTDDRDSICIWNWRNGARLNRFSNGNPTGSRINEAKFINEDDQALLMTGSSDGVVKLFRNYESERQVELVSAFRALTDLVPSNKNAGLVFDWQQGQGKLLVAGDVKVIRVWNAATEICTNDIPARSGSCVTSLTSDQVAGNVFIAGFGDGVVRVFDQRLKPSAAMVKAWREHKQWITNVHMQRGGLRELVSGSRNGEVRLWDIRMDASLRTVRATGDVLRTLSVHEHAPVFATGSERHSVHFYNVNGTFLNSVEPYARFLQHNRSTPIASTAFHPHRMMLACAALSNNHINVFTCHDGVVGGVED
ncbi:torc1 growth control complex subunit kog1 [Lasallia pustulata]|uniref:Torc1 growth control complex subunit kog1 n=1 Tax=Lasallia pustulata TaxID=136370 RepID=A0A1W5CVJ6_9LECA|nr:torc1 growth control complex subunit kog1 [Lasallia pustulata]